MPASRPPNVYEKALGAAIARARVHRGLTQEDLALEVGCAGITISLYETGRRVPDLARFVALCRALGTCPSLLMMALDTLEPPETPELENDEPPKRRRKWT